MKKLLTAMVLCAALGAQAQIAEVGRPRQLMQGTYSGIFNPVLSADGSKMLFSASDYSDLRIYDMASETASAVKNASKQQAFRARLNADGSAVDFAPKAVRTEGSTLYITVKGIERACQPAGECAGYIWASMSPDGSKVMFFAAGKGIYVTDLKGNVLATPGNYEAPVWYGNEHIVAMRATDDGHQYASSQIVLLTADGSQLQALTRPESMTMNPSASIQASKVVYNTIDGRIFELPVTLKK